MANTKVSSRCSVVNGGTVHKHIVYINVSELTKGFNGNTGFHVQTVFTANTIMHTIIINNTTTTFITKSKLLNRMYL